FIVGGPVGDFELLLCHGTVCVVGKMRDLILQLSKSSIYSTKPPGGRNLCFPTIRKTNVDFFIAVFRGGDTHTSSFVLDVKFIFDV
ncbi:hypothetical protein CWN68_22785, partial [Klebsiella michiganensis]